MFFVCWFGSPSLENPVFCFINLAMSSERSVTLFLLNVDQMTVIQLEHTTEMNLWKFSELPFWERDGSQIYLQSSPFPTLQQSLLYCCVWVIGFRSCSFCDLSSVEITLLFTLVQPHIHILSEYCLSAGVYFTRYNFYSVVEWELTFLTSNEITSYTSPFLTITLSSLYSVNIHPNEYFWWYDDYTDIWN